MPGWRRVPRVRAALDEVTLQALLIHALEAELDRRDKLEERRARRRTSTATIDK